jgi:hypothetical protein
MDIILRNGPWVPKGVRMGKSLVELLLGDRQKRPAILNDCERLIADEVSRKKGLTGLALKAGYQVVQAFKPGFIRAVLDEVLLDAFVDKLDVFYQEYGASGATGPNGFKLYLGDHSSAAADALLSITDERARKTKHRTVKKAYEKLRGQAKKHVAEALPRAALVLIKHVET